MSDKIDYSFKVLEEILLFKDYKNRDEAMLVGKTMLDIVNNNEKYSQKAKKIYQDAYEKLDSLSFDEMQEIIKILNSYDDDEDDD